MNSIIDTRPPGVKNLPSNHPDYVSAEEWRRDEVEARGGDVDELEEDE